MSKIRFAILSHGHIENDLAWNIAIPFPASIDNKNPKTEWIKVPTFSVLIEHPDLGYVLYDTGSCPGDEANRLPSLTKAYFPYYAKREEFLDKRLESLNISPEEISTIVVSHMHWDHSGGLKFFSNTKDAKNIYVHKKDFMYGLCVTHQSTAKFAGGGYFKDNFEFENLNFNLKEEDQNLADGLDLVALEGHTPGILGLLIRLESGNYIFPSNAVYTAKNYGPPAINPGIIYDTLGFQRTNGTTLMTKIANDGFDFNFHGITGLAAIILMFIHAVWATKVLVKNNSLERSNFHKLSIIVWLIWLVPFVSGAIFGMAN